MEARRNIECEIRELFDIPELRLYATAFDDFT
jgi:hypothetical protein